jgi:MoaA/NifB/PqqE/SkfB family radical SAM enzyme
MFMTGGEALLRLSLVRELAQTARRHGAKTVLITGLFFARRQPTIPGRIADVLRTVDHVIVSHDQFHEPEVPRGHALDVVARLLRDDIDVSFQLVAAGPNDPYLAETVAAIRERFGDQVPALVAPLGAVGRGASLPEAARLAVASPAGSVTAAPCVMAAWPTVAYDGTVVACCSQDVVDGHVPAHLSLGHGARDSWADIAQRCLTRSSLRALRVYGPQSLTDKFQPGCADGGYCATCRRMSDRPAVMEGTDALAGDPAFTAIEALVQRGWDMAGAEAFARAHGIPEYAELLTVGQSRSPMTEAAGVPAGAGVPR